MDCDEQSTVGGVVLAAGESVRYGDGNKLLAPVSGTPMLARVVDVASESTLDDIVVVLGHEADAVAETLDGVATVYNGDYAAGQSTSVRRGIAFGREAGWDAAVVLLGDMPFVDPETVDRLREAHRTGAGDIVAPRYDGRRGNPVLFARSQFEALVGVSGDRGGRELVRRHPETVRLDTDDPGVVRDIDTVGGLSPQ